jgi:hypothetical protein
MTQSKRIVVNNISDEEWLKHFERLFESTFTDENIIIQDIQLYEVFDDLDQFIFNSIFDSEISD